MLPKPTQRVQSNTKTETYIRSQAKKSLETNITTLASYTISTKKTTATKKTTHVFFYTEQLAKSKKRPKKVDAIDTLFALFSISISRSTSKEACLFLR